MCNVGRLVKPRLVALALLVSLNAGTAAPYAQSIDRYVNVKVMVQQDDKTESTDAVLVLEPDKLVIESKKTKAPIKSFPYASIKSAEYPYAKSPRWKSAIGLSIVCIVCGVATAFMKGKKHWLTIGGTGDFAVIQLDKGNYKLIVPAFEAKSGVTVENVVEEK